MGEICHITNSEPNFGEWDGFYIQSPSSMQQVAAAAFDHGGLGLQLLAQPGTMAMAMKLVEPQPDGFGVGLWLRLDDLPASSGEVGIVYASSAQYNSFALTLVVGEGGSTLRISLWRQGVKRDANDDFALSCGRWYYVAVVTHFSDVAGATAALYIDGDQRLQVHEGGQAGGNLADVVTFGCTSASQPALYSIDEIRLATEYPSPGALLCIYGGDDCGDCIDYSRPIAHVHGDAEIATVPATLEHGRRHFFAARAVSAGGCAEQNTHVTALAEVDAAGELLAAAAGAVADLTAEPCGADSVSLAWTYVGSPVAASPQQFEVLRIDAGAATVIATVTATTAREYQAAVSTALPATLAVRAVANQRLGPQSAVVNVTPAPQPLTPQIM